jgi:hypothetical protein
VLGTARAMAITPAAASRLRNIRIDDYIQRVEKGSCASGCDLTPGHARAARSRQPCAQARKQPEHADGDADIGQRTSLLRIGLSRSNDCRLRGRVWHRLRELQCRLWLDFVELAVGRQACSTNSAKCRRRRRHPGVSQAPCPATGR